MIRVSASGENVDNPFSSGRQNSHIFFGMRSFLFLSVVLSVASLTAREPVAVIPPDSEIAGEGPVR